MAQIKDNIELTQNKSNTGFFRKEPVDSEDSRPKPQTNSTKCKKSPQELNKTCSLKKTHKILKKHSAACEDVYLGRDKNIFCRKFDVRFAKEVWRRKSKLHVLNCDQLLCPKIKERFHHHIHEHHKRVHRGETSKKVENKAINVSPTLSRLRVPKFILPAKSDGKFVQTDITSSHLTLAKDKIEDMLNVENNILKRSVTREVLPKKNFYKEHLQNEVINWLQNVPLFYSTDFTHKHLRENIVTSLVENIEKLSIDAEDNYDDELRRVIDECLNKLPMWLPSCRQDHELFKNSLRNRLHQNIKEINNNFLVGHNISKDKKEITLQSGTNFKIEPVISGEIECLKSGAIQLVKNDNNYTKDSYISEVNDWLNKTKFSKPVCGNDVVDRIMKSVMPLLYLSPHSSSFKLVLKGKIIEILNDLPIDIGNIRNKSVQLNRLTEDLANRLMGKQLKSQSLRSTPNQKNHSISQQCANQVMGLPIYSSRSIATVGKTVSEVIGNAKINNKNEIKEEICNVIINSLENKHPETDNKIINEVYNILRKTNYYSEKKAMEIAQTITFFAKITLNENTYETTFEPESPQLSGTLNIYVSKNPVTSTPKQPITKDIPKLNTEEKSYMDKLACLIRAWMNTLPTQFDDDDFKQIIINDLAGDIMDEVKREQMSPKANTEKEKHINYYVYRWLVRFDIFEDLNDAQPIVDDFLNKLKSIPEPKLTAPQHGTRQAMENLKHFEGDLGWEEEYVPKGIDILEDQISVWMNEQPSEIYASNNKNNRDKMVKNLALTLQDRLRNKSPEYEIDKDINHWLNQVVKPKEYEHIGLLTENLKEKIIRVPQDATLEARNEKRKRQKDEYRRDDPNIGETEISSIYEDPENTMKEFILKYMEHNYDVDDTMARKAFGQLLLTELRRINPPTRKEVYNTLAKPHSEFNPAKLADELEYIKIISDWLKNIPINPLYNVTRNRARVDFVIDLAKNIQEVEEQRKKQPNAMDYELYIASVITQSIRTYQIPVLIEHKNNIALMVDQLLAKIVAHRSHKSLDESTHRDIQEQNLSEFVEEYIRVNGREIANDEVKLEAWSSRLLKEVKKMLHQGADPSTLCKAQVYEKFAAVPLQGDESLKRFSTEIKNVKEISDWLKNLPLLPVDNTSEGEIQRVRMIAELAERIAEREFEKNSDPNDNTADKKLVEYITSWIAKLPLDPRKEIVVPVLIQQLMNRIERVTKEDEIQLKILSGASDEPILNTADIRNPGKQIVESIEAWCNNLPIDGKDEEVKTIKQNIARKMYQKIGELNADPRVYNDDLLYKDLLEDEIDTQLENLPQVAELQNNREEIKAVLLNTILAMKKAIEEKSVGDNYKHKLETTIDAALPDPAQGRQIIVPGFEIYKNHLANKFILDNFDHSDDKIKAKYEIRIKKEVDKYFESAQNKNALPMTKNEMYNELYSELFKVPMPREELVIDGVEEVKTRCELDAWFEDLPLKEADGVGEYLEWDQILSTLAKRIHNIEKYENDAPDEKIRKEATKWLWRLPLLPGQKNDSNINQFVDKLLNALKSSVKDRKYVSAEQEKSKDVNISKKPAKKTFNTSQVAGPSSEGRNWVSPSSSPEAGVTPYNQIPRPPIKRPGDLMVEAVEDWCNQLPIIADQTQKNIIKDNTSTKIVMKICELNMDADIFGDDIIYYQLLDEEIDKIMSELVVSCDFEKSQSARKLQLIEMIKYIKPLIKEYKRREEYKTDLNKTVESTLDDHNHTADKIAEFNKLKDEIVDNFVQYNYNKHDIELRNIYRKNIHDAVVKYISEIKDEGEDKDPLIRRNQLICELSRIPIPNEAMLQEEVEEIRMKNEVEKLFEENSLSDDTEKTSQMKKTLTKRLKDLEKSGHSTTTDKKISIEIARCLKKINKEVSPQVIEGFVNSLRMNEAERKAPPNSSDLSIDMGHRQPSFPRLREASVLIGEKTLIFMPTERQQQQQYLEVPHLPDQSHCVSEKWISSEPTSPLPNQGTFDASYTQNIRPGTIAPHQTMQNQNQPKTETSPQAYRDSRFLSEIVPPQRTSSVFDLFPLGQQPSKQNTVPQNNIGVSQNINQSQRQSYGQAQSACVPNKSTNRPINLQSNNTSEFDQIRSQSVNYEGFKAGTFLNSSLAPQQENVGQKIPFTSGNISLERKAMDINQQYAQATPHRRQDAVQSREPSTPHDVTPESMFQAPVFEPKPLYNASAVPESSPVGPAERLRLATTAPPSVAALEIPEDSDDLCFCSRRRRCKSRPYFMGRMDDGWNDLADCYPPWAWMPYLGCWFMSY